MDDIHSSLRRAVQALAQPAATQLGLFPSFVCAPDELALEFEDAMRRSADWLVRLPDAQARPLQALNSFLEASSGTKHADLWENDSLSCDPRWNDIRELARDVLRAFNWLDVAPPANGAIYVGEGKIERNVQEDS